jgi:endosialidase-like protein
MNGVRLALGVLVGCSLSFAGMAQEERASIVTAAAPVERIRFAAAPAAVQIRIEVRSAAGALVYDSDWTDGNLLDWSPGDRSGQALHWGAYRLVMHARDLSGRTSESEAILHVDSTGMAVEGQPGAHSKITLTAHDGETGQVITTSGDLSFRFGDFLNRNDTEAMRLTKEGNLGIGTAKPQAPLDVRGLIRTSEGIQFPDGTILTTAEGLSALGADAVARRGATRNQPGASVIVGSLDDRTPKRDATAHLIPRPNFAPGFQFVVGDAGVSVGTTNPAYRLDVTGEINTGTAYDIGGVRFISTNGSFSTFVGTNAGTSGTANSFFGHQAGQLTNPGGGDSFFGYQAGTANIAGTNNSFFGTSAGQVTTSGDNSFFGQAAGFSNASGSANTAFGRAALALNTTGGNNVALGWFAGHDLTTGSYNIDIGHAGFAGEANTTRIGAAGNQMRAFISGITGVTTAGTAVPVLIDGNGQLGTASSSGRYKFDVADMDRATEGLMRLRPVTFRYLAHGGNAPLQYGLIAEEVAEVYPELVTRNKDGEVESVMYQFLAPMLLNEVQSQRRQIDNQQRTIDKLEQRLQAVERQLARTQ